MASTPPYDPPPDEVEMSRDELLQRLGELRKRVIRLNHEMAIKELAKLDDMAQRMQAAYEIGLVAMALNFLEMLVDIDGKE